MTTAQKKNKAKPQDPECARGNPGFIEPESAAKLPQAFQEELDEAVAARIRNKARRPALPVKIVMTDKGMSIDQSVSGDVAPHARLMDALGSRDAAWANYTITGFSKLNMALGTPNDAVQAGLAFLNGLGPQNEVESALGAQMFTTHAMMTRMAMRAEQQTSIDAINALYGQYNKLARTYTAQVEALAKLRNGGKQTVEVKYVDARNSQNIIADTVNTGGGGSDDKLDQSVAQALAHQPSPPCAPLWSQVETDGLPVQGTGNQRQA